MNEADIVVFHNGIGFDHPALKKIRPDYIVPEYKIFDTLVASRLIYSDIGVTDARLGAKKGLPGKLYGSHSLEAWGHRLGEHKGNYDGGWEHWSPEMQSYCCQDVTVTRALYEKIVSKNYSQEALELEHEVSWICAQQERNGFAFDVAKAERLYADLLGEYSETTELLRDLYRPWYTQDGEVRIPKRSNSRYGYWGHYEYSDPETKRWVGYPYSPVKLNVFNPNSRDHIADRLKKVNGWSPVDFTPSGKPKVDESILSALPYDEAKQLARLLSIKKLMGMIGDGDNAWLKMVTKEGRIHGRIITNGAVTGRATHSSPNLGQVPSAKKPYGKECRDLFTVDDGNVLVGCDVSGLELRMLAHFMAQYDDGAYAELVVNGDVHTANQQAAGLVTRDQAKTFIYAFLYGAGDEKIGSIAGGGAGNGKRLKSAFFDQFPALENLVFHTQYQKSSKSYEWLQAKRKTTHWTKLKRYKTRDKVVYEPKTTLTGLDGRTLALRSPHAALNTLLQSAGALICKRWMVEFHQLLREHHLDTSVKQVAWVHDELQLEVDAVVASAVGQLCVDAIKLAGQYFNIRCELTGEFNVGRTWKETH